MKANNKNLAQEIEAEAEAVVEDVVISSDESSDDQLDQHDGNVAEEIENDAPTNEFEESPTKPKRSAGWTIYSSVHEKNGKEDDSPWQHSAYFSLAKKTEDTSTAYHRFQQHSY